MIARTLNLTSALVSSGMLVAARTSAFPPPPPPPGPIAPPAAPEWERRTLDIRDGNLRCILGHSLKLHAFLMAWDGYKCDHIDPRSRFMCTSRAFYVRGRGHRVFAVEATAEELRFIHAMCMGPTVALAWLGVELPPNFALPF